MNVISYNLCSNSFILPQSFIFFQLHSQNCLIHYQSSDIQFSLLNHCFFKLYNQFTIFMSHQKIQSKPPKLQDFFCSQCNKRYGSNTAYKAHIKNKHTNANSKPVSQQQKILPKQKEKPKDIIKPNHKLKGFEQYQQDIEDKIYAFLGELGEKHIEANDKQQNQSEESDRMMGQANYLENNVVRTPFELEFDISKQLQQIKTQNEQLNDFFKDLKIEIQLLNQKLSAERDRWEFRDPLEIQKYQDEQFSLINIQNVLNNYKKKNLDLKNSQFSIFLLWLAKITKPTAWRQFYLILGYALYQYKKYRIETLNEEEKNQNNWKSFNPYLSTKLQSQSIKPFEQKIQILQKNDISEFLKLYYKWVTYFGLF